MLHCIVTTPRPNDIPHHAPRKKISPLLPPRLQAHLHRLRAHTVRVGPAILTVPPGVLDPVLFRSGGWFAQHIARQVRPGQRLLDVGCGSGVVGVLSQRRGAQVTAVDIDPAAVRAAHRNGISDVRQGDLLAVVPGERFDHICFNPPYFPGNPSNRGYDRALFGGPDLEVIQRFLAAVSQHLNASGHAWMVLSDRAPLAIQMSAAAGWNLFFEETIHGERLSVWRQP